MKRLNQADRKFNKSLDVSNILKALRRSDTVSESILTPEQRLMVLLQRQNVIEDRDLTESSDNFVDYYEA